jgi:hypothetical protein
LYLVFVLPSEGFLYGSVTEGLQFSVSYRIELFPLNLIAAARTFLDSELAIPPELLLCSEPTGRLDKGVEGVSTDWSNARYFLKLLSLRVLAAQLKKLSTSRLLFRVRLVPRASGPAARRGFPLAIGFGHGRVRQDRHLDRFG